MLATFWAVVLLVPTTQAFFHSISKFNMTSLPADSLFGYSITYQPSIKSLIVSAPKANNFGKVFTVDLRTEEISEIKFPIKRDSVSKRVDDFWLGAAVKAGSDFFVTCAPRHSNMTTILDTTSPRLSMIGECFISSEGNSPLPLQPISKEDRNRDAKPFDKKMDSFGWGIDISQNKVLIGGPVMSRGRVSLYSEVSPTVIPKLLSIPGVELPAYSLGYNVASGIICAEESQFAVSSLFGTYGQGQVYLFNATNNKYLRRFDGERVGSMFGATLCSARLEGSNDLLLVGAPTYANNSHTHDVGAVYIFDTCSSHGEIIDVKRMLMGDSKGGYFGSAIISVADMDGDGSDEVVIGAPYADEGRGIVYVYSGAYLTQDSPRRHTVQAQAFSFGFSLTALQDYDENGINELAIGSPDTNEVFLYRSYAYITVKLRSQLPDIETRINKTFVDVKSCIDVGYPAKPKEIKADIVIKITIGNFNSFEANENKEMEYEENLKEKRAEYCREFKVLTPTEITSEYNQIISYTITAKLKLNPIELKDFDPSRVLLSDDSELLHQDGRGFRTCGNSTCVPHLIGVFASTLRTPYIIGTSNTETFSVLVVNDGNPAYDACVKFEVEGVYIPSLPRSCIRVAGKDKHILCKPTKPNPLVLTGNSWNTGEITLDTKELSSMTENVTIKYGIYNHCSNESDKESFTEFFKLVGDSDGLSVHGISVPDKTYAVTTDSDDSRKILQHVYTIINDGVTNWNNVQCKITLNEAKYIKGSDVLITINSDTTNHKCKIPTASQQNGSVIGFCDIGELERNKKRSIYVNIRIDPASLESLPRNKNVTFETSFELLLPKVHVKSSSVSTSISLLKPKVDVWIIIVATLAGLLVWIIAAIILYATGFLKRKNKDKLRDLQRNVNRQSERRSMMRNSILNALRRESCPSLMAENEVYEH